MFFELIAAIVAGVAGAGTIMLLRRNLKNLVPRWTIPAAAGASMIAVGVFSEYAWFDRQSAALAEAGVEVVDAEAVPTMLRPWTFAAPFVDRFVAVDVGGALTREAEPNLRLSRLIFFRRYYPTVERRVLIDCAEGRIGDLTNAVQTADGAFERVAWSRLAEGDGFRPAIDAVCAAAPPSAEAS